MLVVALLVAVAALSVVIVTRPGPPVSQGQAYLASAVHVRYSATGPYVGPDMTNIAPPVIVMGRHGVPVVRYARVGIQQNPVIVAEYGLRAYSRYVLKHHPADRAEAFRAGAWLLAHQHRDGLWLYAFPFVTHGALMKPPWSSALAQGQAISLFERLYHLTGQRRYLTAALSAFRPLTKPVSDGGLLRCFRGNCSHPFLEEYPDPRHPIEVLNGFMFTILGVYDLATIAPGSGARRLYLACRRTVAAALPSYDLPGGIARYDLASSGPAAQIYQAIHVYLLRALNQLEPSAEFRWWANHWQHTLPLAPPSAALPRRYL